MCHCDWEWLGKDLWAKKSTRHQNNNMYFGKTCMYVLYEIACFCSIPWAWTWTLSPLCQSILCRAAAVVVQKPGTFLTLIQFWKKMRQFGYGISSIARFFGQISTCSKEIIVSCEHNVKKFRLGFRKITMIIAYARYYKPQLLYFLHNFSRLFLCFQGGYDGARRYADFWHKILLLKDPP